MGVYSSPNLLKINFKSQHDWIITFLFKIKCALFLIVNYLLCFNEKNVFQNPKELTQLFSYFSSATDFGLNLNGISKKKLNEKKIPWHTFQ